MRRVLQITCDHGNIILYSNPMQKNLALNSTYLTITAMQYATKELGNQHTVKPRFTGPLWRKELSPVNQDARYIGVHSPLIYTQSLFSGDRIEAR